MLKIALVLVENVFFGLKNGISQLLHWAAPKHTAYTFNSINGTHSWKTLWTQKVGMEIRLCLVGISYDRSRIYLKWASNGHEMQLLSNVKNLYHGKQCCRSNGLKYVAACEGCQGTECQNCVTVEIFEEEENNIDGEFDNNIFDAFG